MNKLYVFGGILALSVILSFLLGHMLEADQFPLGKKLGADVYSSLSQASSSSVSSTSPSSPLPIIALANSSSSPIYLYSLIRKAQYKLLTNFDPCTLEKLASAGWQINQIGSVTSLANIGYDNDCQTRTYWGIDWALLERER